MKKQFTKLWKNMCAGIVSAVLIFCMGETPTKVYAAEQGTPITQTIEDTNIIPDKYNTMAVAPYGGFTTIERGSILNITNLEGQPMTIKFQDSNTEQKINLQYANKDLEGTILFENIDFSATMDKFTILNGAIRQENKKKVHFIFKNCVFKSFNGEREGNEYVEFTFENCTFKSFWGSNATIKRCYFGGGITDRIIPFCRVTVKDCYIANPTSQIAADGEIHVDGTQMYGWKTTEVYDVRFDGCRFEMPALKYPNAPKSYVNACIMLQLEFNNGHDISFTDCYVNGGGYSVYASYKNDCTYRDTYFKNLKFGCAARWGKVYPKQGEGVTLNKDTWTDAASVYVGTVNRDSNNRITLSVSNDTNQERTFKVFTSSEKSYDFTIEACPKWSEFNGRTFEEFPFDKVYTVPEASDWIVCYDTTNGDFKQVRYMNWDGSKLVLTKDENGNYLVKELEDKETPTQPELPVVPENPEVPEQPENPETPEAPENPVNDTYPIKSVTLTNTSCVYSGKNITPKVIIKDEKGTVISSSNYSVTYENNKNVGMGIVNITMKGDYKGTYIRKFIIKPVSTSIRKISKKKNQITVAWKQNKNQTTGYQIQISTNKSFAAKNTKTYFIKNNKTVSKAFKNLKTKKNYYVRIRTYTTVKVEGVKKNIYSNWSTKKWIKL